MKEAVVIPFPDPKAVQPNLGPLCDGCRRNHYPRNEGRGKCGHATFLSGINYCCRCAILQMICRGCGADLTNWFRQLGHQRESRGQRKRAAEKPKMKKLER